VADGRILKQRSAAQNARALLAENVDMLMIDPLYVASGFGVGLLVGMTGVGGGSLMTPLLILLFGIHPATAVGTDLLYAAATKTGGSVAHGWARSIHWPAVIRLASGSIPASVLTLVFGMFFASISYEYFLYVCPICIGIGIQRAVAHRNEAVTRPRLAFGPKIRALATLPELTASNHL